MNAFHIFSSAPFFAKNKGPLRLDKTEIYCMVISALMWKRNNGSISLITDKEGGAFFEKTGITDIWDKVQIALDKNDDFDHTMFWAGGKILALRDFPAPCVMIDTDFIVWKKLTFSDTLIAAHEEDLNPDIYPDIKTFDMSDYTFADGLDMTLPALNTAFLYMPDEDFKQYYVSQSIAFMKKAKRGGDYLTYMVFAEQRLLPMLAKKCGIRYTTLLDKDMLFLPQDSYTHLWGAKQAMRDDKVLREKFIENSKRRIQETFPEHSYLIDNIENYFKSIN